MSKNKNTRNSIKLKSLIITSFLFVLVSGFSQTNKANTNSSNIEIRENMKMSSTTQLTDKINANDTTFRPAQDYNSSRSNKPRPSILLKDTLVGKDTVPKPLHAQDYNSSRSNRPTPIRELDDKIESDSIPGSTHDNSSVKRLKANNKTKIE
ncbi:MAG TPA: hypothetical protein VJY12_06500 [Dysgonamonadaceae bacterium]|nr:hypothetical protein [Dysgonamonadaceae bacterium]